MAADRRAGLAAAGARLLAVTAEDAGEVLGVNTLQELAVAGAERILRKEINAQAHAELLTQLKSEL